MLLFIHLELNTAAILNSFNTSHVTLYLFVRAPCRSTGRMFQYISCYSLSKTSNLCIDILLVSIHLMLLFILFIECKKIYRRKVSIHLMLLFIKTKSNMWEIIIKFQYISCYSLSQLFSSQSYPARRFNTSHVTLYQWEQMKIKKSDVFQYISCYSLSNKAYYIKRTLIKVSIHLMLLFILLTSWRSSHRSSFNTSHVTLYPSASSSQATSTWVSIHLMLLFIRSLPGR